MPPEKMPRKPLIEAGSILPAQDPESGGDVMSRIIARDRERRLGDEESTTPQEAQINEAAPMDASVSTEIRKPVSTEVRTDASKPVSTEVRADGLTDGRKHGRKSYQKEDIASDFLAVVDEALASREPLLGGVKATVDMAPELSTRAKRYLADHRGQSTRQVLIALFEAFLTAKGY